MIHSVSSNNSNFKKVEFRPGYNIVLAERNREGKHNQKGSRNGAGKTTLIEIIHFCLGAKVSKDSIFNNENLKGWSFILKIDINEEVYDLERFTDNPNRIYIKGSLKKIEHSIKYDKNSGLYYITPSNLNKFMTMSMYGIQDEDIAYSPSFRELISYSIRRNVDGFKSPFEFFAKQKTYSIQSCNAYLLNLSVEYASRFQEIKDKKNGIKNYKNASKLGIFGKNILNIGELNTELISQQCIVEDMKAELKAFQVHPQYNKISKELNEITLEIHNLTNDMVIKKSLLKRYEDSIANEHSEISIKELEEIYNEAGFYFGNHITKSLSDVLNFHKNLIKNRKEYLSTEINELKRIINRISSDIRSLSDKRAELMKIIETHGALEEYSKLQERYSVEYQKLEEIKKQLEQAEYIENSNSLLKIEGQKLLLESRKDYSERIAAREKAISLFRNNTEYMYPEAGVLTIDLKETGYSFGVEIKNSRSQGVNYMKVFCYDMVLAELGLQRESFPNFWIHDSTIFDGVDERQSARALMLAESKCKETGLQYICLLNSDMVPYAEFEPNFVDIFENSVILRISDQQDEGLLGIRF